MIVEFTFKNFLSYKDTTTLSMVAAKSYKEYMQSHVQKMPCKLNLLKSSIIYGNNASGKSNLIEALRFMKSTVINSFRDALVEKNERKIPLEKFSLNAVSEIEPSSFELTFFHKNVRYRYGFEINSDSIVSEWLFHTTSKEVYLFRRDGQEIEINKTAFKEGVGKEGDVKNTVLFLSILATLGKEISSEIIEWFKNLKFIKGINDIEYKQYTISKIKSDRNFLNWVIHFIKYLEISSISTSEQEDIIDLELISQRVKNQEIISLLNHIQDFQSKQPKRDILLTYHRKFDENNFLIDTIPFNFDEQESEGTKKLIYLLGPWYDALRNGKVLVVDEIDSRLHRLLTVRLIDFFHRYNRNGAQLICASHDISLLDKDIYRRDQIWFVEKNQFGASELVSLSDFKTDKVRNKSAFRKNYVDGKYGAIPYFEMEDKLVDLLYKDEVHQ